MMKQEMMINDCANAVPPFLVIFSSFVNEGLGINTPLDHYHQQSHMFANEEARLRQIRMARCDQVGRLLNDIGTTSSAGSVVGGHVAQGVVDHSPLRLPRNCVGNNSVASLHAAMFHARKLGEKQDACLQHQKQQFVARNVVNLQHGKGLSANPGSVRRASAA
jgi:hypothetical protein